MQGVYTNGTIHKGRPVHEKTRTKMYEKWCSMKRRCNNPNTKDYKNYGGRGIAVCEEWNEFIPFMEWSNENGYSDDLEIDRRNNELGYSPSNCRYITRLENASNKRSNHYITIGGNAKTITQWAETSGLNRKTIQSRINYGWKDEDLLLMPKLGNNQFTKYRGI